MRTPLRIIEAGYKRYALPLTKPLTTDTGNEVREGFLLRITAESAAGTSVTGVGEVAPLPGESPRFFSCKNHDILDM